MKKMLSTTAIAALLLSGATGLAVAQPTPGPSQPVAIQAAPGAAAAVNPAAAATDTDANQALFDLLISAISNQPATLEALNDMDVAAEDVSVVDVNTLLDGDNLQTLEANITTVNSDDLAEMIGGNDALTAALGDNAVENVIAIAYREDQGDVVIFVWDRGAAAAEGGAAPANGGATPNGGAAGGGDAGGAAGGGGGDAGGGGAGAGGGGGG